MASDSSETLNIYTTHKLGKIERAILVTLANETLDNNPLYGMPGLSEHYHSHVDDQMARQALYHACGAALAHLGQRSAYSAFGRALHSLFDKGLVAGYALGWHYVEKEASGEYKFDDLAEWAGPGRPAQVRRVGRHGTYTTKNKSPVLSVVLLSEAGWDLVRRCLVNDPNLGLCPLCMKYLEEAERPAAGG